MQDEETDQTLQPGKTEDARHTSRNDAHEGSDSIDRLGVVARGTRVKYVLPLPSGGIRPRYRTGGVTDAGHWVNHG